MSTEQTQQTAPAAPVVAQKQEKNVILDVASEIESLGKTKALNLATKLIEEQGSNDFRLGGVFLKIQENAWFDGFESFDAFVSQKYGFQSRKAYYLIDIYKHLTTKSIPWEKVSHIGWTKLRDLAPVLTLENLDQWVAKANACTVLELQAALKSGAAQSEDATSVNGTSDSVTFKLKLKKDQLDTVMNAIAKAKADIGTTFDAVGLETICTGYNAGVVSAPAPDLSKQMLELGWEAALTLYAKIFPGVDVAVTAVNGDGTVAATPAAQ